MPRFRFRELKEWLQTLASCAYNADVRFECDTRTRSAVLSVLAYPCLFDGMPEDSESTQPIEFTIRSIEPYRCESKCGDLEIDFTENGIAFRTVDLALWDFEEALDIICNSPADCEKLFRNVVERMEERASDADIIRYLDPSMKLDPPFWLGQFPKSLFREVREALDEMQVAIFVPNEPKSCDRPFMLEIVDEVQIIAKDFEVEILAPDHMPAWFRAR